MKNRKYLTIFVVLSVVISVFAIGCYAVTIDTSDDIIVDNDQIVMTPEEFEQSKINVEVSPTPVIVDNSEILNAFQQNLNSAFSQYNLDYFTLLPLLEKYEFIVIDQIDNFYFLRCNNEYYILSHYDLISLGRLYD